ncbi:MAG: phosphoribosylformylglycinamidine synthase I [Firmicutes bacterium]|nr:phosphoribosylformylglycinamidine synthase I [Bacillota bacterium]
MNIAVVTFPGSNCDDDTVRALHALGASVIRLWYRDRDLGGIDGVILPGGFSYGDYLRGGALAAQAPVMEPLRHAVRERALPVLGICNGFQILTEAKLLPGALRPNRQGTFLSTWQHLRVTRASSLFWGLREGEYLRLPIAHGEGAYYLPPGQLASLFDRGQAWLQYVSFDGQLTAAANPNGSVANLAGVIAGSVAALMPHPERAMDAALGSADGVRLLTAWLEGIRRRSRDASS